MNCTNRLSAYILIAFMLGIFNQTAFAQNLVDSEEIDFTTSLLISVLTNLPAQYDVRTYKVTYNTIDTQGEPTVASGAVSIPVGLSCTEVPMVAYCHGTVLRQLDVPSQNNFESLVPKALASTGFIAVAPDYLGLGEHPGIHPYVHGESQATATIDLILAARELVETLDNIDDNGELFITGYSQGGHAAMATLKYAQDNGLNQSLGIVAGAPCSGPYNLSGSQAEVILSDLPYSNPGYVVYLLIGYEFVYGNLYNDLGDIIQAPFDEAVLPFFDGAQNEFDMAAVNAILPGQISELMVDTVLANFESNDNHPLWIALRDNDNFDWAPDLPLRMFYCDGDEQVAFENSTFTEATMIANGAADVASENVLPGANHGGCIIPALTASLEFFQDLATPCDLINVQDAPVFEALVISPNPASNRINLNLSEAYGDVTIYDMLGRKILEFENYTSDDFIDISGLQKGAYIVLSTEGGSHHVGRLVVE